jgi:hypothetical protein
MLQFPKRKVLTRASELQDLNEMSFNEKWLILLQHYTDPNIVIPLADLTGMFGIQNSLHVSLQCTEIIIMSAEERIQTFQKKICEIQEILR